MTKTKTLKTPRNLKSGFDYDYVDYKVDEAKTDLKEMISHLPTKDEFYEQTLKILKKLDSIETSNILINNRVSSHSDEIYKLQKIHPRGKHPIQG